MYLTSRLRNAVPTLVLASAAHRLMSGRYAPLELTGRRSGRTYRIPVADVRDGTRVLLSTDSPWWRTIADRPVVRLRLQGHVVTGSARIVTDDREAAKVLNALVQGVPGCSRPAGVASRGGRGSEHELPPAVTTGGRRSIEVALSGSR